MKITNAFGRAMLQASDKGAAAKLAGEPATSNPYALEMDGYCPMEIQRG